MGNEVPIDPFATDDAAEELLADLMEVNSEMQQYAIDRARELDRVADVYEGLARKCRVQAALEASTAVQLAHQTADLIKSEFSIEEAEFEFPDDSDDTYTEDGGSNV